MYTLPMKLSGTAQIYLKYSYKVTFFFTHICSFLCTLVSFMDLVYPKVCKSTRYIISTGLSTNYWELMLNNALELWAICQPLFKLHLYVLRIRRIYMNPTSTQVLHWLHRPLPRSLSLLSILLTLLVVAAIIIILQVLHFLLLYAVFLKVFSKKIGFFCLFFFSLFFVFFIFFLWFHFSFYLFQNVHLKKRNFQNLESQNISCLETLFGISKNVHVLKYCLEFQKLFACRVFHLVALLSGCWTLFALVWFVLVRLSSIIWCKTYALLLIFMSSLLSYIHHLAYLLSVSYIVARDALSIKYRGSVDPSMCVVQSKAHL